MKLKVMDALQEDESWQRHHSRRFCALLPCMSGLMHPDLNMTIPNASACDLQLSSIAIRNMQEEVENSAHWTEISPGARDVSYSLMC